MVKEWEADGIKPLVYMNPNFADMTGLPHRKNYFEDGDKKGIFVKNLNNETYTTNSISIRFAMVDFTNPAGREWAKDIIKENIIKEAHAYGYMADFGEHLPLENVMLYDGSDPAGYHNRYPEEWAKVNEEALEEMGMLGEVVPFMRATGSQGPGSTVLYWKGDQLPTWDAHDGIKTTLIAGFSGGVCGMSLTHSDLGAYTIVNQFPFYYKRTKELYMRWIEVSAFSDVMFRTHPSSLFDNSTL